MESEENTERKGDSLDDDPGEESIELELVRSSINLLNFKVVGYPQSKVTQDQEGDDLSPRLCLAMLLSNILMFQVSNEEKLKIDLDQLYSSIDHHKAGWLKCILAEVPGYDGVAGVEEDTRCPDDQKAIMLILSFNKPQVSHLNKANNNGDAHEDVDSSVSHIDDENCNEMISLLVDQWKEEDQSNSEGYESE